MSKHYTVTLIGGSSPPLPSPLIPFCFLLSLLPPIPICFLYSPPPPPPPPPSAFSSPFSPPPPPPPPPFLLLSPPPPPLSLSAFSSLSSPMWPPPPSPPPPPPLPLSFSAFSYLSSPICDAHACIPFPSHFPPPPPPCMLQAHTCKKWSVLCMHTVGVCIATNLSLSTLCTYTVCITRFSLCMHMQGTVWGRSVWGRLH